MNNSTSTLFAADDLIPRLVAELGYSPTKATIIARKLATMDPDLKTIFWYWWQTGIPDSSVEVLGYTVVKLMEEFGLQPVPAFSTLSWLRREPERALESLQRGYDRAM